MKTTIAIKSSRSAIKFVAGIVPRNSSLPILGNVLCYANGKFELTGTDLDVTLRASCPTDSTVDGKTTIPARALLDMANSKADSVDLSCDDKNVTTFLTGGNLRAVCGLSADEFPAIPAMPESAARVTVPADAFLARLKSVAVAQSTDESRYVLNGVMLEIDSEQINFVATDGRRLHATSLATGGDPLTKEQKAAIAVSQKALDYATSQADAAQKKFDELLAANPPTYTAVEVEPYGTLYRKEDHYTVNCAKTVLDTSAAAVEKARAELAALNAARQIILPAVAVKHILRLPVDKKTPGVLTFADWTAAGKGATSYASVTCGECELITRQIEGNYPNYKQVIPNDYKVRIAVNVEAFRDAVAVAEKATSEKSNSVKLTFTNHLCTITGKSPEVGEATATVATNYSTGGVEIAIALNPSYLLDACAAFAGGDEMNLEITDELCPLVVTNAAGLKAVIMPVRMS